MTPTPCFSSSPQPISTHTPLARRDEVCEDAEVCGDAISTHTPLARRDAPMGIKQQNIRISTHTPLARRDDWYLNSIQYETISTHTPLARRDPAVRAAGKEIANFYSHASCEA